MLILLMKSVSWASPISTPTHPIYSFFSFFTLCEMVIVSSPEAEA